MLKEDLFELEEVEQMVVGCKRKGETWQRQRHARLRFVLINKRPSFSSPLHQGPQKAEPRKRYEREFFEM